jgi:hypothetical protein
MKTFTNWELLGIICITFIIEMWAIELLAKIIQIPGLWFGKTFFILIVLYGVGFMILATLTSIIHNEVF